MFSFLESGHYFGTAKKGIVDNQFGMEGVIRKYWVLRTVMIVLNYSLCIYFELLYDDLDYNLKYL